MSERSLLFPFSSITITNRKMLQEMTDSVALITCVNVYAQLYINLYVSKHTLVIHYKKEIHYNYVTLLVVTGDFF